MLVLANLISSASLAASTHVPHPIPDYALQADAVYRLEIGAACFVVVYLAAMAFFLALDGRGFVELGTRGLRAERVVGAADDKQQVTLAKQIKVNQNLEKALEDVEAGLEKVASEMQAQERRLRILEAQTIS